MSLIPAPGDLVAVSIIHTNPATATAINVLHYRVGSISGVQPTQNDFLGTTAQAVADQYLAVWAPTASDQVSITNTRATNVFPLPRSVGVNYIFPAPEPGAVASEAIPLQDAVTILKRTAVGNRWGLGRVFVTGCPENAQANGIISNGQRTLYNALAAWLGAALAVTGSGWTAVLNPCLKRGPDDNPISITNVLSCEVSNNIIKTQRRRRPGKGI